MDSKKSHVGKSWKKEREKKKVVKPDGESSEKTSNTSDAMKGSVGTTELQDQTSISVATTTKKITVLSRRTATTAAPALTAAEKNVTLSDDKPSQEVSVQVKESVIDLKSLTISNKSSGNSLEEVIEENLEGNKQLGVSEDAAIEGRNDTEKSEQTDTEGAATDVVKTDQTNRETTYTPEETSSSIKGTAAILEETTSSEEMISVGETSDEVVTNICNAANKNNFKITEETTPIEETSSDKDRAASDTDCSVPGAGQSAPDANRTSDLDNTTSDLDKTTSDPGKPTSDIDKPTSDLDKPTSDLDKTISDLDKTTSDLDKTADPDRTIPAISSETDKSNSELDTTADISMNKSSETHIQSADSSHTNDSINPATDAVAVDNPVEQTGDVVAESREEAERAQALKEAQQAAEEAQERDKLEKQRQMNEDKEFLMAYIAEASQRLNHKAKLRAENLAITKDRPELNTTKLDSSLKKNTAFIKKLRNFTESQFAVLEKEVRGLNLSRYVGEAANALLDARLKMADIGPCVELCSALHQRYAEFAPALLQGCSKMLKDKEKQDDKQVSNLSKLRVDLRLYAELVAAGIFTQKEGLPLLGNLLTGLVNSDKTEHRNVSVIVSFCRYCGEDYMALLPSRVETVAKALNMEADIPRSDFLPKERHKNVRQLMKDYYSSLHQHLLRQHKVILREEQHNRRLLETRGEVEEGRVTALAAEVAALDKLMQQATAMADYLREPMPQLPVNKVETEEGGLVLGENGSLSCAVSGADAGSLWEDEDARAFYTSLPQLKEILPSILYSESANSATKAKGGKDGAGGGAEVEEVELDADEEVADPSQLAEQEEQQDNEEEERAPSSSSVKSQSQKTLFAGFLNTLTSCISRDLMDAAALEFCLKFNTKPYRKKLARALFLVPRHRQDLLPFYARLVAGLQPLMPDLPADLLDRLKMDFRYQVKKKDQVNLESKVKVCRFLGELVKFGVMSGTEFLAYLKMLLNNFKHHHIEMACAMLETAGRYLFRTPSTHHRTKVLLEQMKRTKTVMSFEARYVTLIENAYYYVNPPASSQLQVLPPLPPMLQYARHITTTLLNKTTVERVLRLLRKFDWQDREVADYCVQRLAAAWEVKFYNIRCLANVVSGLVLYHEWVGPAVVDSILEDIRVGLETNLQQLNQRRVAAVKYLAELYNYKVIESNVIFKVLYSLISFGRGDEMIAELDPPEQLLRLRLVVTILDTCGAFFSSGLSKRKLDCFLTYFQHYYQYKRYCWTASSTLPIEYEQAVRDCLNSLRPGITIHENMTQSWQAVDELNRQLISKAIAQAPELRHYFPNEANGTLSTITENEDGSNGASGVASMRGGAGSHFPNLLDCEDEDEEGERDRGYEDDEPRRSSTQEDEDTQGSNKEDPLTADNDDDNSQSDDVEEQQPPTLEPVKCEEDDDFLAAFERMMSDTLLEHSRDARPNTTPLALPLATRGVHKKTYDQLLDESRTPSTTDAASTSGPSEPGVVKFVLMSRNSNRGGNQQQQQQQLTTISVPEDCEMVNKMRSREKQQEEERRNVKRVTLEITERQEEEEAAQELLQQRATSMNNLNRERRVKFQHPKGAPDADLIFGSSSGGRHKGGGAGASGTR